MHGMNMGLVAGVCNLRKYMGECMDDDGDVIIGYIVAGVAKQLPYDGIVGMLLIVFDVTDGSVSVAGQVHT